MPSLLSAPSVHSHCCVYSAVLCPYFYVACRSWGNREMGQCAGMQQFIKSWQRNGARHGAECHVFVHTATHANINLPCMLRFTCFICGEMICARDNDACLGNTFGRRTYCSTTYGKTSMYSVFLLKLLHLSSMCLCSVFFLAIKGELSDDAGTHFSHTYSRKKKKSQSKSKDAYHVLLAVRLSQQRDRLYLAKWNHGKLFVWPRRWNLITAEVHTS